MRIAFVGKGGSGKTTLSTYFVEFLSANGISVLALDADINIHFARNLGVDPIREKALSYPSNKENIRNDLRGTNPRMLDASSFVKTTPPGGGSTLIRIEPNDGFIQTYATRLSDTLFVAYVGTYETDEIGVSCYHTNLGIAENIVSHLCTDTRHWLVTDMVAGTDAFSGSLHLLFDAIFLVVEPTPEGVAVFEQYKKLAQAAGMWEHVWAVGNKILDDADEAYLKKHLQEKLVCSMRADTELRRAAQDGTRLPSDRFGQSTSFERMYATAKQEQWDRQEQLKKLYALHLKHAGEEYIISSCGDVRSQIDPNFIFPA